MMSVNLKILKYIFAVLGIIVSGFVAFRSGFSHIGVFFCYIGYLLLASPFFYPAFYGNKWDYLRIILFTLFADIITFGLVVAAEKINHISGMEGMTSLFLQLEFLFISPILVLITTAFCCRMKKLMKTVIPWGAFFIYAALNTYLLSTIKYDSPGNLVIFLGSIVLLPLLLLTAIMTIRILFFTQCTRTAEPSETENNQKKDQSF
jgi:hypothetical protein